MTIFINILVIKLKKWNKTNNFIKLRKELIVMIYIKNNQLMRKIYNLNDKQINSKVIL